MLQCPVHSQGCSVYIASLSPSLPHERHVAFSLSILMLLRAKLLKRYRLFWYSGQGMLVRCELREEMVGQIAPFRREGC